jgi:hypothetical protein
MITLKPSDAIGVGGEMLETLGMQRNPRDPKRFTKDLAITELLDRFNEAVEGDNRAEDKEEVNAHTGALVSRRRRRRRVKPTDFLLYEDNSMYALPYLEPLTDRGIRPLQVSLQTDSTVALTPINAGTVKADCGCQAQQSCSCQAAEPVDVVMNTPKAESPEVDPLAGLLVAVIAMLRAVSQAEHSFHWYNRGTRYAEHLLFERLYKATQEDIDTVAEKLVGLTGNVDILNPLLLAQLTFEAMSQADQKHPMTSGDPDEDFIGCALMMETDLVQLLVSVLDKAEADGLMTDGLENLLQGLVDKHEGHVYLLSGTAK